MAGSLRRTVAIAAGIAVLSGCMGDAGSRATEVEAGDRRGLSLRAAVSATDDSIVVETVVANNRATPVYLDADQCGRVTDAVLARTRFEPRGRRWSGSLQAVKRLVLDRQASHEQPVSFAPRIPGNSSSDVPSCVRPTRPVKLLPGQRIGERWELPFGLWPTLAEVGSVGSEVRIDVVEARAPDDLSFLDILQARHADRARAGRNLRLREPASSVVDLEPTNPPRGPSLAELCDRLLENPPLRRWIEAQPADSWREAELTDLNEVRLSLVTTRYERAALVTADTQGRDVSLDLPGERDRTRVFPRRPGTLPPGIQIIEEPDGYVLAEDVLAPSIELPSGRVVVGEYLFDEEPLPLRVEPGAYRVHATLARDRTRRDAHAVALATLVLSDRPTVRWKRTRSIAVDGGTTTITSPEGAEVLRKAFDRDEAEWWRVQERIWDSHAAHDHTVTEVTLRPGVDLAHFSSGYGDGGYPVYVGLDAAGRPTRVVVDFFVLHLDWPS